MPEDPYPPIRDYALLSDCHSAALVSSQGSVDWACVLRFDTPSVFGRLLDWERGGHFSIRVVGQRVSRRRYLGPSLVLETTLEGPSGTVRLLDGFSMHEGGAEQPHHQLLRVVEAAEGEPEVDVVIEPRFDYGELRPWLRHHGDTGVYSAVGGAAALVISSDCHLEVDRDDTRLTARLRLRRGQRMRFAVQAQEPSRLDPLLCDAGEIDRRLDATVAWWRSWAQSCPSDGPYADQVARAAVVLKGLSCAPTGAIVAAPTASLPEWIGGRRNWDYRYTWVRDSTLMLAALDVAGHPQEAQAFRDFILRAAAGKAEDVHIMYGVDGARHLVERELPLPGYRGSAPVRVGNAAHNQTQHDMYGQILDTAHLWQRKHIRIADHEWEFLRGLVDRAAAVWEEPDAGIWEFRTAPRHFVHSKVWLWAALDRGLRLAAETGRRDADLATWATKREAIRTAVERRGVDPDGGHFVQAFGSREVDAALLELPMLGFVRADDDRMVRTVAAIRRDLTDTADGFVRRYRSDVVDDGVTGSEGVFLVCGFWLAEVLARQGCVDDATAVFERLLDVSNDVGLFAEQYDPSSGDLLGNFPQGFSHMALINAAHELRRAQAGLSDDRGIP